MIKEIDVIKVFSIDDIDVFGVDILVWDGCQWHIDYIDICAETGALCSANNNEIEAYALLPDAPEMDCLEGEQ